MARQIQQANSKSIEDESLFRVFIRGFFSPIRFAGKGLAWVSHKTPFKQIGHGLKWFFNLRGMRLVGRIIGLSTVRNSQQELKQVTWPTLRESRRLTSAVIIFSVIFGAIVAIVDFGLDKLFKEVLLK